MAEKIHIKDLPKAVGREFVSDWVPLDQKRISEFADVTDDHNWVHVDIPRATALRGGTIAHGLLTLTLFPGLLYKMFEITGVEHGLNYGLDRVRFTGIVRTGTRVRMRLTIKKVEQKGEGVLVTNDFVFERENEEKPALIGTSLAMAFPAKAAA